MVNLLNNIEHLKQRKISQQLLGCIKLSKNYSHNEIKINPNHILI